MRHELTHAHAGSRGGFIRVGEDEAAQEKEQIDDHRAAGVPLHAPEIDRVTHHDDERAQSAQSVQQDERISLQGAVSGYG